MRKIFLFMNVSLDGYVADAQNDISGFHRDFEPFSASKGETVDALLFGHRTYELMKFWSTPEGRELMPEIAQFMNERQKYVAAHQPFNPGWSNVTVLSEDVPAAVQRLKAQPGYTIAIFGSNTLCVSLMPAGLIDEFQILVNPLVFGAGISLFQGLPQKQELTLTNTRQFQSGTVMLTYAPAGR